MRDGRSDPYNNSSLTGEEIIQRLLEQNEVLIPCAISPHGRWGPMFHYFLFGKMTVPHHKFPHTRPFAAQMYWRAMRHPCPSGIVNLACANWKKSKSKHHKFYGYSYATPTPKEYALQHLGLAFSNAIAIHVRDAKQGRLVEPTDINDDDYIDPDIDNPDDADELNNPLSPPTPAADIVAPPPGFNDATFAWAQGDSTALDLVTAVPPLGPQLGLPFESRAHGWFSDPGVA